MNVTKLTFFSLYKIFGPFSLYGFYLLQHSKIHQLKDRLELFIVFEGNSDLIPKIIVEALFFCFFEKQFLFLHLG